LDSTAGCALPHEPDVRGGPAAVSGPSWTAWPDASRRRGEEGPCGSPGRVPPRPWNRGRWAVKRGMGGWRISSAPRKGDAFAEPMPLALAKGGRPGIRGRSAPWDRGTTIWRSRSPGPRTSSTRKPREPSASSSPTRWSSCSTAAAGGFGHQVATDYLRIFLAAMRGSTASMSPIGSWRAPLPLPGGAGLLRRHEVRRQHVLRQSTGHPPPDPRGILRGVRERPGGPRDAPGLRRFATTRPRSSGTSSRGDRGNCSSTGRGRPGRSVPGCRGSRCLPEDGATG